MAVKKKSTIKKKSTAKKATTKKKRVARAVTHDTLVHIQADEALVMRLKILAAKQNKKMYELVNEVLTEWLKSQTSELESIANLFSDFK